MSPCGCDECRVKNRHRDNSYRNPRQRWDVDVALDRYHRRWVAAREGRVAKAIADLLGHAREHTAQIASPLHYDPAHGVFSGIDRTTAAPLLSSYRPEPFSAATMREAVARMLAYVPPAPAMKPWISRERAAELVRDGVRPHTIALVFDIY